MKTERIQVSTQAGRGLENQKISPKLSRLVLPNRDQIIFWEGKPYAVSDNSYIYALEGTRAASLAGIHKNWGGMPLLVLNIVDFEYTLGQALSKAGLMLVRRLDP